MQKYSHKRLYYETLCANGDVPAMKIDRTFRDECNLSQCMGKPTVCIGENKGADQLRSNCEADQRLCFRYTDSTIFLLLKSESSSF